MLYEYLNPLNPMDLMSGFSKYATRAGLGAWGVIECIFVSLESIGNE
jgi:hypothetical protein